MKSLLDQGHSMMKGYAFTATLEQQIADLLKLDLRTCSQDQVRDKVVEMLHFYQALGVGQTWNHISYRARRCETGHEFDSLKELIYPATGSPNFGRAQLPGERVLYSSWNPKTALAEVQAVTGDLIQIIAIRPIGGIQIPFHVVGEYQHYSSAGYSIIRSDKLVAAIEALKRADPGQLLFATYVDSFFAEMFRRRVDDPLDHKITAAYAGWFHQSKQGGVMYPSVKTHGGMNYAIPAAVFDTKYEVLDTMSFRVERSFGYGIQALSEEKFSCTFDQNGTITWGEQDLSKLEVDATGKYHYGEAYRGWRVTDACA